MGWNNPLLPWRDLERSLSWGTRPDEQWEFERPQRDRPDPAGQQRGPQWRPYAELHCHSYFSFMDGASSPEALVGEAVRLGLTGLAITDHDGLYGAVRFAEAARGRGLATVYGAELSVGADQPRAGSTDPGGEHLLVLARGPEGYRRLSAALGAAHLAGGEKGRPLYDLTELSEAAGGHWAVLSGCRKGAVRRMLAEGGVDAAQTELRDLVELFGAGNVFAELIDHHTPGGDDDNDRLAAAAAAVGVPVVASGNVHYATPPEARVAETLAARRSRRTLDEMRGWLSGLFTAHLRSGQEMQAMFRRFPGVLERAADLAAQLAFDFDAVAPRLPPFPVPDGDDEASWLAELTMRGAADRYGPRAGDPAAYRQLDYELQVITQLGFPGYFLIVHDIVEFCRANHILCQGRGSAANSAVCYALGITAVDPVAYRLVFERFLSPERDGPPDIDLDIEAGRREEVIQYVYDTYGRHRAAQVANVITYRARLSLREAARALGHSPGQIDAWSRGLSHYDPLPTPAESERRDQPAPREVRPPVAQPAAAAESIPPAVLQLAHRLQRLPRHLGIHSGGMVICDRPIAEVCPTEWARMPGRSVLQWDKDDCAAAGLVKIDLLGLGMLSAIRDCFTLIAEHHGVGLAMHTVPKEDPTVYDMLCAADTVGVFQVESRAQMATLPRIRPRQFYDLVVEIALIRPGPIQGGAVHPYLRRRRGDEPATAQHPLLDGPLSRTLGIPLFQEQVMSMAVSAAGFTATEADRLRRAMSAKHADEKVHQLRDKLLAGMAANGIPDDVAADIYGKIRAFSSYGFPESHAISFAIIVYVSAWLKRYYPAAFTAALLRNQPMGFYSPQSLVSDVRRHGVTVRGVDLNASHAKATLEQLTAADTYRPAHRFASPIPQPAIRLGLASVRNLSDQAAETIADERTAHGPYTSIEDLVRRTAATGTALSAAALEALATAGAFGCLDLGRRQALWTAGALAGTHDGQLDGTAPATTAPPLAEMTVTELTFADLWSVGITIDNHPIKHRRADLTSAGVTPADQLPDLPDGQNLRVAGLVTHRQRPPTAGGVVFLNLEDETGMVNVICPPGLWDRQRRTVLDQAALIVFGRLERAGGAINLLAYKVEPLRVTSAGRSRDFR